MAKQTPRLWTRKLSWCTSGLILVLLRPLELAHFRSQDIGDVFWLASTVGVLASFVGLVICIVAVVRKIGRRMGWTGIATYLVLSGLFFFLYRSPSFALVFKGRGGPSQDPVVVKPGEATLKSISDRLLMYMQPLPILCLPSFATSASWPGAAFRPCRLISLLRDEKPTRRVSPSRPLSYL